jgi:hypothetical protein
LHPAYNMLVFKSAVARTLLSTEAAARRPPPPNLVAAAVAAAHQLPAGAAMPVQPYGAVVLHTALLSLLRDAAAAGAPSTLSAAALTRAMDVCARLPLVPPAELLHYIVGDAPVPSLWHVAMDYVVDFGAACTVAEAAAVAETEEPKKRKKSKRRSRFVAPAFYRGILLTHTIIWSVVGLR